MEGAKNSIDLNLLSAREKLEESMKEIDDRVQEVVQQKKEFERLELKLLNHTISL